MRRIFIIFLAILLPIIVLTFYFIYDANIDGIGVQCSFYQMTGLQCPGCGGQRALHYLLHGEFLKALHSNLLLVIGLPFLIYLYIIIVKVYGLKNAAYINIPLLGRNFGIITIIVILSFFFLRNIPYPPFTYLSPIP